MPYYSEEASNPENEETEYELKTKITWEFIILEELRTINKLIIESGRSFSKQNIYMLREAIDSWEKSLMPLVTLPVNNGEIDRINTELKTTMDKLLNNWSIENYTETIEKIIEKKGVIIKILAQAGKYMPISTFLMEKDEVKDEAEFEDFNESNTG